MKINGTILGILGNYHNFCNQNEMRFGEITLELKRESAGIKSVIAIKLDSHSLIIDVIKQYIEYQIFNEKDLVEDGSVMYLGNLHSVFDSFHELCIPLNDLWR